jgi:hypothetical protein
VVGRVTTDAQLPLNLTVSSGSTGRGSSLSSNPTMSLGSTDGGGAGQ